MKKKFLLNMILFALTLSSVGIVKDNAKTSFAEEKEKITVNYNGNEKWFGDLDRQFKNFSGGDVRISVKKYLVINNETYKLKKVFFNGEEQYLNGKRRGFIDPYSYEISYRPKGNIDIVIETEKADKKVTIEVTERAKKFIEGIVVYYDGKEHQYKPGEKYPEGSKVGVSVATLLHAYDSKGNRLLAQGGGNYPLVMWFNLPDSEKVILDIEYTEGNFETVSGGKKFKKKNGEYAEGLTLINGDIYLFDSKTKLMKTGWDAHGECMYFNEEGKLQRNTWIDGYYVDFWGFGHYKPGGDWITDKDIQKIVDKNKDKPKTGDENKDKPKIGDENKDKPKNNQILTDKNGNKVESKTFDFKNLKFNVEKLNEKVDKLNGKVYDLFDISFNNENGKNKKLPNGEYLVTLQKENGKEVEKVYYVDDNGNIEEREFTQTQKEVTFKTNHFSKYAILYKTTEKKPIIKKAKNRNSLPTTAISSCSLVLTGLALAGTTFTLKKRNK